MKNLTIDILDMKNEEVVQSHFSLPNSKADYLILEFDNKGIRDYLVVAKIAIDAGKAARMNLGLLIPLIYQIINANKKNAVRTEKLANFHFQKLLESELANHLRFTTEFYDLATEKYQYTRNKVKRTVSLEQHNNGLKNKYCLPNQTDLDSLDQHFNHLNILEQRYTLNDFDLTDMSEKNLEKYIKNNGKKMIAFMSNLDKKSPFNKEVAELESKYKNEFDNLFQKRDVDQLAFRYFVQKHQKSWLNLAIHLQKNDEKLVEFICKNRQKLLALVQLSNEQKESFKQYRNIAAIEEIIFETMAVQYQKNWFNAEKISEMSISDIETFIENHKYKLLSLMKSEGKSVEYYHKIIDNKAALRRMLTFYIDSRVTKLVSKKEKDDMNERKISRA